MSYHVFGGGFSQEKKAECTSSKCGEYSTQQGKDLMINILISPSKTECDQKGDISQSQYWADVNSPWCEWVWERKLYPVMVWLILCPDAVDPMQLFLYKVGYLKLRLK